MEDLELDLSLDVNDRQSLLYTGAGGAPKKKSIYLTPSEFGQSPKSSFLAMHSGLFPDAVAKVVAVVLRTLCESILNIRWWPDTTVGSPPMAPALGIEFRDRRLPSKKWGSVDEGIRKG